MAVTLTIVVAGVVSVVVRTRTGTGPTTSIDGGDAAVLLIVAAPSLLLVPLTSRWRIWWLEAGLAALAWLPLAGPAGDTSCTDCGFVLLIPLNIAAVQIVVFLLAFLIPRLRVPAP